MQHFYDALDCVTPVPLGRWDAEKASVAQDSAEVSRLSWHIFYGFVYTGAPS